jgi:hypothetical protein
LPLIRIKDKNDYIFFTFIVYIYSLKWSSKNFTKNFSYKNPVIPASLYPSLFL